MQFALPFETADLRKRPPIEAPADPLPYVRKSPPRRLTEGLPIGTQARFAAAAEAAATLHTPLNVLLTIRWRSLFSDNDVNPLRPLPPPERIRHLTELLRKWLVRNGAPSFYIWVRENADSAGEHWHIAVHLPQKRRKSLVSYVANLTGEPASRRRAGDMTKGEFACGALGSWHLAHDTQPERGGAYLAAYLGKGEPSQRLFRGKLIDNDAKPFRGASYGGTFKDGDYDLEQGKIEGTANRSDRFFIANELKRRAGDPPQKTPRSRAGSTRQRPSNSNLSAVFSLQDEPLP